MRWHHGLNNVEHGMGMPTVHVAGTAMVYREAGSGSVTVFIVPGLGLASAEWWSLQDTLAGYARTITWDRPGCGDSGPARSPRTLANIAHEALDVLASVAPDGPLVLVGHSQGGLYANAIARLTASRVRGLLLLDPAHPDNSRLRRELPADLFRRSGSDVAVRLRMARVFTRLRLTGLLKPMLSRNPPLSHCRNHPSAALDSIWRHMKRTQTYDAALAEYDELETRTTQEDLVRLGSFPDIPVTILVHDPEVMINQFVTRGRLSRADAERVETLWGELLRDDTYSGRPAKIETVTGADHLIHLQAPQVVLEIVKNLVRAG